MTTLTERALMDIERIKNLALGAPLRCAGNSAETLPFPVDLYETPDAFVIVADLPGVSKDDLKVHVVEDRLRISAVRRSPVTTEYLRSFRLPGPAAEVQARLKDGVLTVTLPKPDRMKPFHIPVTADANFTI
jgi:HSP20 family protein